MNKKVIDLEILEDYEDSGVSAISLVDVPAIEKLWMAFSEEDEYAEDMAYYTADGKLYTGPTHRTNGRLMTGAEHTADSEFLYRREELAEVGPRGGIRKSDKAPKSDTPNKDPKGEGSAKGSAKTTRGAEVDATTEASLQKKADEFNEKYKDKLGYGANIGALKTVYQRGLGAFNTSHSPNVSSPKQWAMARVNAFLYIIKNGRPENPKYTGDNDLLPKKHPKGFAAMDFESYDDYPIAARNNAQRALDWVEDNGWGDCGTPVGKQRANQLAKGEAISEDTIARMAAFERHRQHSDTPYGEGCGGLMWDCWGGDAGIKWATNKLARIREDQELSIDTSGLPAYVDEVGPKKKTKLLFTKEDEQIVVGPAMIPNMEILRKDDQTGEPYYVKFSSQVIAKIAEKFMRELRNRDTNIQHNQDDDSGSYVMENWLVENVEDKANSLYGMDVPLGTWMVKMRVQNPKTWELIKSGELRGFSIEGNFMERSDYLKYQEDRELYNRIIKILKSFD